MSSDKEIKEFEAALRELALPIIEEIKSGLAEVIVKVQALSEREDRFSEKLDSMSDKLTRLLDKTLAPQDDE